MQQSHICHIREVLVGKILMCFWFKTKLWKIPYQDDYSEGFIHQKYKHIHTSTYTHTYITDILTYTYMHISTPIHTHIYSYMHACTHTHTHIHTHTLCVCVCMRVCVSLCTTFNVTWIEKRGLICTQNLTTFLDCEVFIPLCMNMTY